MPTRASRCATADTGGGPTGSRTSSAAEWSDPDLGRRFADDAYATVKGHVRTSVLHRQLLGHLPPPPARVLDVGGGAGHQSFPLARLGYEVTVLDQSEQMLDRARTRLAAEAADVSDRVTLRAGDGLRADDAVGGRRFDAVMCHGVLGYFDEPGPMVAQLCRVVAPGGIVSVMTANAAASAVRPAMERRWDDALAAFDATTETGVLGVASRADTVDGIAALMRAGGVEPVAHYGVWLFVDLLGFAGTEPDPADAERIAEVEFEAARRDPYRQLSRVFHLVGRRPEG